jgi:hypothetical protein
MQSKVDGENAIRRAICPAAVECPDCTSLHTDNYLKSDTRQSHLWCNGQRARFECGRSLGQTKYCNIGICWFYAKHATYRSKSKDWLSRNQYNVSEWSDMSTQELLFQWVSTVKTGCLGTSIMCLSGATCLPRNCCFSEWALWKSNCWSSTKRTSSSPWYILNIAHMAFNNNHFTQAEHKLSAKMYKVNIKYLFIFKSRWKFNICLFLGLGESSVFVYF